MPGSYPDNGRESVTGHDGEEMFGVELPEVPTDWRGKWSRDWLIPWEIRSLGEKFTDKWCLPEGILGHYPDQVGEVYEIDWDFSEISEEWNRTFWGLPDLRSGYKDKNWLQREHGAAWGAMLWEALRPGSMALAVKNHMDPCVIPVRFSPVILKVGSKVAVLQHCGSGKRLFRIKKVGEQRSFPQIGRNRGSLSRERNQWILVIQRPSPSPLKNTLYNPWEEIMAEWAYLKKARIVE